MKTRKGAPLRVGMVGCGKISDAYFKGCRPYPHRIRFHACADLDLGRARAKACEHGVPRACTTGELLLDPEIDIILNLTVPKVHAKINLMALRAGKHVYCEKPFAMDCAEGRHVLAEAKRRKLKVGCAPDTVLGGGIQTCRKLIDAGAIGKAVAAISTFICHGHESWHPDPEFYYQAGGAMYDMAPYGLTSLVTMLGPAKRVMASAKACFATRTITSAPKRGEKIKVRVPTHETGIVEFVQGTTATVTMSYDLWAHHQPVLEIYGSEGSLDCPDPNGFGGEVGLWTPKSGDWKKIPLTHNAEVGRGFGLAEMADAILHGRSPRASGEIGLHVLEIMQAFHQSSKTGRAIVLKTSCKRPAPLKPRLPLGRLD